MNINRSAGDTATGSLYNSEQRLSNRGAAARVVFARLGSRRGAGDLRRLLPDTAPGTGDADRRRVVVR